MAAAGVEGAIGGHRADLLAPWDLIEKVRQDRAVAFAAGTCLCRGKVPTEPGALAAALAPLTADLAKVGFETDRWSICLFNLSE